MKLILKDSQVRDWLSAQSTLVHRTYNVSWESCPKFFLEPEYNKLGDNSVLIPHLSLAMPLTCSHLPPHFYPTSNKKKNKTGNLWHLVLSLDLRDRSCHGLVFVDFLQCVENWDWLNKTIIFQVRDQLLSREFFPDGKDMLKLPNKLGNTWQNLEEPPDWHYITCIYIIHMHII